MLSILAHLAGTFILSCTEKVQFVTEYLNPTFLVLYILQSIKTTAKIAVKILKLVIMTAY